MDNLKLNTDNLSRVLPEAIAQRPLPDKDLTEALVPTIEDAIHISVRKDANIIATAIFPALLPGIRKVVAAAISEMTQSLNQTLDHSFSVKSLQWRVEALLTGKSFAEIVLLQEEDLSDTDLKQLQSSQKKIEQQTLRFTEKKLELASGQINKIQKLVQELKKLLDSAQSLNKNVQVKIIGHANTKGLEKTNLTLSQARAHVVLHTLVSNGVNRTNIEAVGVGSTESLKKNFKVQNLEITDGIGVSPVISFEIRITDRPNTRIR